MYLKTVRVTNPLNVLVQIPTSVVAQWKLTLGDTLDVEWDGEHEKIIIKPTVQGRVETAENSD